MNVLRIAHLADTHIGMENYGRINPETGLNQRLHDFLNSLDQALDSALRASVDLVVFAGDIYKTRDPTPTHQREFARRIHRLASAGIQTVIVAGNHDLPLTMGHDPMYDLQTFDLPGIALVALGHIPKQQVLHYASPPVVYAGSIERVDFGEQDEAKGWVYAEISGKGRAEWGFRQVSARP